MKVIKTKTVLSMVWDKYVKIKHNRRYVMWGLMDCQKMKVNENACMGCRNQYVITDIPRPIFCNKIKRDDY